MKLAYSHLIKHIPSKPSIDEISEKLFQLGHEHEIVDYIFDIEFTPNRGDCLSINGLLRDLAIFYDVNLKFKQYDAVIPTLSIDFVNNAKDACKSIFFLKIDIEHFDSTLKYSDYLESYFFDLKINKNNFFTDISNYLSYELGQPTHCYDASKIDGTISLEHISCNDTFDTLLDKTLKLTGKNLVFLKNEKIINLAGIIGDKNTSCSSETNSVIIECAHFNPEFIIGKSLKYDIHSDAAHKFERGVDIGAQEMVLRRFIQIVQENAKILNLEIYSNIEHQHHNKEISFNVNVINNILGTKISEDIYKSFLLKLGFTVFDNKIEVPSFRTDILNQNDLAEEVARCIGYNNIELIEMNIEKSQEHSHKNDSEYIIKTHLMQNGFYEVINNPFVSDNSGLSLKVDNPLDSNRQYIRTNLQTSLLNNLLYNERRQNDCLKFFEISDVYSQSESIKKKKVLAIIASGKIGHNFRDFSKNINQNYLENILNEIFIDNKIKIETLSRANLDTKVKNEILYVEIDITNININKDTYKNIPKPNLSKLKRYKPISEFPCSSRDLSFSIKDYEKSKNLEDVILNIDHNLIKDKFIFDYYKNEKNNEIKLGCRFVFQCRDKTITDIEVNEVLDDIIKKCLEIDSVSIPGLKL